MGTYRRVESRQPPLAGGFLLYLNADGKRPLDVEPSAT